MPYQKCIYDCKFCIAKGHNHEYQFENLYQTDKDLYLARLKQQVQLMSMLSVHVPDRLRSVIITGEADPSQNMEWVYDVIKTIRPLAKRGRFNIEIQTRNHRIVFPNKKVRPDVIALSVSSMAEFNKAILLKELYPDVIIRPVVILNKKLNNMIKYLDLTPYQQVTFKELQYGEDPNVNDWIQENEFKGRDDLKNLIFTFKKDCSIVHDYDCQNAKARYRIYRSDAEIYYDWEQLPRERK